MTLSLLLTSLVGGPSPVGAAEAGSDPIHEATDEFTQAAFQLFVQRDPNPGELEQWRTELLRTGNRGALTVRLARSDEWLSVYVDGLYRAALDRHADDHGQAFWIDQLQSGQSTRVVAASIFGSDESMSRAGTTDADYVAAMYRRVLGREADKAGLAYWQRGLSSGDVSGPEVVLGLWSSPEFRNKRVLQIYRDVLDRRPDTAGLTFWSRQMLGSDEIELAAVLAASDEFYTRVTGAEPPPAPQPDPIPQTDSTGGQDTNSSVLPTPPAPGDSSLLASTGYSNVDSSYLGNPWFAAGVGNVPLKGDTKLSFRFAARQSGTIYASSFYIVENTSRIGYSSGNCGSLEVELRPDLNGDPSSTVLARAGISNPCDGPRAGQWLTKLAFDRPANIAAGSTYHLVFRNTGHDPDNNWVSVNLLNRPDDNPDQVAFATGDNHYTALVSGRSGYAAVDQSWGRRNSLDNYFPLFEVHLTDGNRQGLSYVGTRASDMITVSPGGTVARQTMQVTNPTTAFAVSTRPYTKTDDVSLEATVSVNGRVAATVELRQDRGWFTAELPASVILRHGDNVTVDVAATRGSAGFRALYRANHDDWVSNGTSDFSGGHAQVSHGSGWVDHRGDRLQDLPLYLATR